MCKRIVFTMPKQVLQRNYGTLLSVSVKAKYNISPGMKLPVRTEDDEFLNSMSWGLIPYNSSHKSDFESLACIEIDKIKEVVSSNSQRCIIPANGYLVWNEKKEPFYVTYGRNPHFAFAGICESWDLGTGKQIQSFGILMCKEQSPVSHISESIPIAMSASDAKNWLSNEEIQVKDTPAFMIEPSFMIISPVSKDVLDPAIDHQGLIKKGNSIDAGENFSLF